MSSWIPPKDKKKPGFMEDVADENESPFAKVDPAVTTKYQQMMVDIATALDGFFNGQNQGLQRNTGFVLLTFPYQTLENPAKPGEHRVNYISNGADRDQITALFREIITRFEARQSNFDTIGSA